MGRKSGVITLSIIALFALAACSDSVNGSEMKKATETGSEIVSLSGGTVMLLDVQNEVGTVTVRAGSDDKVQVDYKLTAFGKTLEDAREEVQNMSVKVEQQEDRVVVNAVQSEYRDHSSRNTVDLTITIPATSGLKIQNDVGDVKIAGINVPENLEVTGDVGNIILTDVAAQSGMTLTNDTGNIQFQGSLGSTGSYTITNDTGNLDVTIPSATAAKVDASVETGVLQVSGLSAPSPTGNSWRATLGTGDNLPSLKLRVSTGNLRLAAQS